MDFGKILDEWEKIKDKTPNDKTKLLNQIENKPDKKKSIKKNIEENPFYENSKKINPMEMWLRHHGVIDKDSISESIKIREKYKSLSEIEKMPYDAKIDLHGFFQEKAWQRLENFISECDAKKMKKVLIIHGKGIHSKNSDAVLPALVRRFIEADSRLGRSGHPDASMGGNGATWVILKKNMN